MVERHVDRRPLILHPERHFLGTRGEPWLEMQDAVADLGTWIRALHQVHRPRHDTHVDTFPRRSPLDVLEVAA